MAKKGLIAEFKEFIARGNVMDLAVGVIIGGAFQSIVNSLVNDMIMPVISLLTGGVNFSNWVIRIGSGENDTIRTACQKSRSRQPDVHTVHLSFRLRIRKKKNKEKTGIIRQRGT